MSDIALADTRFDVFISYSRRDLTFIQTLVKRLEADKRKVWVDWDDIPTSVPFEAEIEDGIDRSDSIMFVISPDSVASKYCQDELSHAIERGKHLIRLRQNWA